MNKLRICDICGATSEEKTIKWFSQMNCFLCSKHRAQMYRNGKITDTSARTTIDRNEYIIKNDYAELVLRDKNQNIKAIALIDKEDVEKCKNIKWSISDTGYVNGKSKKYKLHRYILDYDGPLEVDHINRNKLDNRKENLRIVSKFTNAQNNGALGVSFNSKTNKWRAEFQYYGKYFYVGEFDNKEEAINKRLEAISTAELQKEKLLKEYLKKYPDKIVGIKLSSHNKWIAEICTNGKKYHIGTFNTKTEATEARNKALVKYNINNTFS